MNPHDDPVHEPQVHVYSLMGLAPITANVVAHEARHCADYLREPRAVNRLLLRARKAMFVAGSLAVAGMYDYAVVFKGDLNNADMQSGATAAIIGLLAVNCSLLSEYRLRSDERRAFAAGKLAAGIPDIMQPQVVTRRQRFAFLLGQAGSTLKQVLLPNFNY